MFAPQRRAQAVRLPDPVRANLFLIAVGRRPRLAVKLTVRAAPATCTSRPVCAVVTPTARPQELVAKPTTPRTAAHPVTVQKTTPQTSFRDYSLSHARQPIAIVIYLSLIRPTLHTFATATLDVQSRVLVAGAQQLAMLFVISSINIRGTSAKS